MKKNFADIKKTPIFASLLKTGATSNNKGC
jgi:hypothetical protein